MAKDENYLWDPQKHVNDVTSRNNIIIVGYTAASCINKCLPFYPFWLLPLSLLALYKQNLRPCSSAHAGHVMSCKKTFAFTEPVRPTLPELLCATQLHRLSPPHSSGLQAEKSTCSNSGHSHLLLQLTLHLFLNPILLSPPVLPAASCFWLTTQCIIKHPNP